MYFIVVSFDGGPHDPEFYVAFSFDLLIEWEHLSKVTPKICYHEDPLHMSERPTVIVFSVL